MKSFFIIIGMLLTFSSTLSAETLFVNDESSIQKAIENALDGDSIIVLAGTYTENINYLGKSIVLKSQSGPDATTIQAPGSGSVISFINAEDQNTFLEGFCITHGQGTYDSDFQWYWSDSAFFGGGIYIKSSSPTIKGNIIQSNNLSNSCRNRGAGIAVRDSSYPIIIQNTIRYNHAQGGCDWYNYFGGGIWVDSTSNPIIGGALEAANNIFHNYANDGGQIYRLGKGEIINAQFNYFGNCPPRDLIDIYTFDQIDISNCLDSMITKVSGEREQQIPQYFKVYQNYPNPFNLSTTIPLQLLVPTKIKIMIYNCKGELSYEFNEIELGAGFHNFTWNAKDISSGIYVINIEVDGFYKSRKCVLLK